MMTLIQRRPEANSHSPNPASWLGLDRHARVNKAVLLGLLYGLLYGPSLRRIRDGTCAPTSLSRYTGKRARTETVLDELIGASHDAKWRVVGGRNIRNVCWASPRWGLHSAVSRSIFSVILRAHAKPVLCALVNCSLWPC